jgi:hypothetical protein
MNEIRLVMAWTLVLAMTACSSSTSSSTGGVTDASSPSAPDPSTSDDDAGGVAASVDASSAGKVPANDATIVLTIPSTFTGTTRELDVVVTPTVPIAGPPAGILFQAKSPAITAGQPVTLHGDTTGVSGKYYVVVVLYMEGGGQFSPMAGVDYEAQSSSAVTFEGTAIDLGTLPMALVPSDGGL